MPGTYDFYNTADLGIWVKRSNAWQKVTTITVSATSYNTTAGLKTIGYNYVGSLQLGTGIQAFGVTVEAYSGTGGTIDKINSVQWTAQGSGSGQRTALPNGSTTTITVRPK